MTKTVNYREIENHKLTRNYFNWDDADGHSILQGHHLWIAHVQLVGDLWVTTTSNNWQLKPVSSREAAKQMVVGILSGFCNGLGFTIEINNHNMNVVVPTILPLPPRLNINMLAEKLEDDEERIETDGWMVTFRNSARDGGNIFVNISEFIGNYHSNGVALSLDQVHALRNWLNNKFPVGGGMTEQPKLRLVDKIALAMAYVFFHYVLFLPKHPNPKGKIWPFDRF